MQWSQASHWVEQNYDGGGPGGIGDWDSSWERDICPELHHLRSKGFSVISSSEQIIVGQYIGQAFRHFQAQEFV